MGEDSIDASPSSLNRSLRQKLEHRKIKRRFSNITANNSVGTASNGENLNMVDSQFSNVFWDSDSEEDLKRDRSNQILKLSNDFERFKAENMLVAVDRNAGPFVRKSHKSNAATQMFQTCARLLESQQNLNTTEYVSCEMETDDFFNVQTEWLLEPFEQKEETQTNLDETLKSTIAVGCNEKNKEQKLNFFDDDLNDTFLDVATQQPVNASTNNTKTIVEQIREDFCASLSSSSDDESKFLDFEPFFRFRRKRIRTYERRYRRPHVSNNAVVNSRQNEEFEFSDTSSELSVQEGKAELIPVVQPLALDTSGAIHTNLLNLSAFFTQNLLDLESCWNNAKSNAWSRRSSLMEDNNYDDDNENPAIELNGIVPYNLRTEIHALRLKYENFSKPILCARTNDLLGFASEAELAARVAVLVSPTDVFDLGPTLSRFLEEGHQNKSDEAPLKPGVSESVVFDEDTWQDDAEFFVNFKTQAVLKTPKSKSQDSKSTNKKPMSPIKRTKSNELSAVNKSQQKTGVHLESQIDVEDTLKLFEQPNNEVKTELKPQAVDENIWKCDFNDIVLSEWPLDRDETCKDAEVEEHNDLKIKQAVDTAQDADDESKKNPDQCHSKQVVDNDDLLDDFLEKEEFWNESLTQFKKQETGSSSAEQKCHTKQMADIIHQPKNSVINSFCQPSTSKQAAAALSKLNTGSPLNTMENILSKPFMGFRTASSKIINISDLARRKAEQIFAQLPDFPKKDLNNVRDQNKNVVTDSLQTNVKQNESLKPKESSHPDKSLQSLSHTSLKEELPVLQQLDTAKELCEEDFSNIQLSEWLPTNESPKQPQKTIENRLPHQREQETSTKEHQTLTSKTSNANTKATAVKSAFPGFQTASSKPISISENAIKKYKNFFDEITNEDNLNTTEQPIAEKARNEHQKHAACKDDFSNIKLSEWLPSNSATKPPRDATKTEKEASSQSPLSTTKRKFRSLENTASQLNEGEQPTKMLCKSHTMHDISKETSENVNLRTNLSQMQINSKSNSTERTPGVIVRRNLLSLSRQRKSRLRQSLNGNNNNSSNDSVETPVKLMSASQQTAVAVHQTPNAAEFHAHLPNAASTPQARFETPSRRLRSSANLDEDFQRINWEQLDDSKSTTATTPARAESSTLNGTLKPLPSPQERIENLSTCGDPPPLPKIVTSSIRRNRCLGLSRRSKKNFEKN